MIHLFEEYSRLKDLYGRIPLDVVYTERMKSLLDELDTFGLGDGDYAIFGSGPLAVRGVIEPSDLDVLIRESKYEYDESPKVIGNIEFSYNWPGFEGRIDELINSAEMIDGYPYVKLEYVEEYKNNMERTKDDQHIMDLAAKMLAKYINDMKEKDKKNKK